MTALDHYLDDLDENVDGDTLLTRFLEYTTDQGLELYPAQEEAIMELFVGNNVILNTPTGSGKSLVALAAHFRSVALGERLFDQLRNRRFPPLPNAKAYVGLCPRCGRRVRSVRVGISRRRWTTG